MVRHTDNVHLAKYTESGLAVPDWLVRALQHRETAGRLAHETGSSSSTPTSSRLSLELPGSGSSTPSPLSRTPFEIPQPLQPQVPEFLSETPDMTNMTIADSMFATFGLPGQLDSVATIPAWQPAPGHVDFGLNLADFVDNYNQVPIFPQAGQMTADTVPSTLSFSQTSNDGFYQDPSDFHTEISALFSQQTHDLPNYEDLVALTDSYFVDTATSTNAPSDDFFALFATDGAVQNNQYPVLGSTFSGSPLDLFSTGEQVHMNLHNFF
ncbi:hypothetical protein P691DRAFT_800714 [Macrolepiota fuliginosa MF-IS2]|uniref:Uncharacterized protein n=1 Tax=Macrolepiota fuliginosa MF-IS2 TaxID=1400762 RepID=A0A9P5XN45_9AGAR|nr:hypothetical protein P691DRAFT_800714 [Macrolepiota fuliginosa MF-IS2]